MRIHDSSSNPSRPSKKPPELPPDAPLRDRIVHAIRQVYDPEIPINIYELGLIYGVEIDEATKKVRVKMTLTTPNCPEAQSLPQYVKQMVERVEGVNEAEVEIVWEPMWNKEMMSDAAKLQLGMM